MNKVDGEKVRNFIETYYKVNLSDNELIALSRELKDYTYESFESEIKQALIIGVRYFSIAELSRIVENNKKAKKVLLRSGKTDWNEFYINN
jgi:hypothetical protein